jgi:hypothetical protein
MKYVVIGSCLTLECRPAVRSDTLSQPTVAQ